MKTVMKLQYNDAYKNNMMDETHHNGTSSWGQANRCFHIYLVVEFSDDSGYDQKKWVKRLHASKINYKGWLGTDGQLFSSYHSNDQGETTLNYALWHFFPSE